MMASMEFDLTIKNLNIKFKEALQLKRDFYVFLCQDYVDIEILYIKGQEYVKIMDVMETHLHRIHDLNPNSLKCTEMTAIFIDFFDIK